MRRFFAGALLFMSTWSGLAPARVTETTAYTKKQALNGAFRYLRVDSSLTITERDLDLGYLLFEYPTGSGNQKTTGSLEVIERDDEVLLIVQISALPSYHESRLIRGLVSKLRADYGDPPRSRKSAPEGDGEPPTAKDAPAEEDTAPRRSKSAAREDSTGAAKAPSGK